MYYYLCVEGLRVYGSTDYAKVLQMKDDLALYDPRLDVTIIEREVVVNGE